MVVASASDPNPLGIGEGPTLPAGAGPAKEATFLDASAGSGTTASTADSALDWDRNLSGDPRPHPSGPRCDLTLLRAGRRSSRRHDRPSSSWTAGSAESDALAALLRASGPVVPRAREVHWHASRIKDSVAARRDKKPNDDEVHEDNARLEDWLVPRRSGGVDEADAATERQANKEDDGCHEFRTLCLRDERSDATGAVANEDNQPRTANVGGGTKDPEAGERHKGRGVRFSNVLIRDYPMVLGDNPSCGYGPPVTLDWCYLEYTPLPVDEYERHRPPRRTLRQMGRNYYNRKDLLLAGGYTEEDFRRTKKEMKRIKNWRAVNRKIATNIFLLKAGDAAESLGRKLRRARTGEADHWKREKGLYSGEGEATAFAVTLDRARSF